MRLLYPVWAQYCVSSIYAVLTAVLILPQEGFVVGAATIIAIGGIHVGVIARADRASARLVEETHQ